VLEKSIKQLNSVSIRVRVSIRLSAIKRFSFVKYRSNKELFPKIFRPKWALDLICNRGLIGHLSSWPVGQSTNLLDNARTSRSWRLLCMDDGTQLR